MSLLTRLRPGRRISEVQSNADAGAQLDVRRAGQVADAQSPTLFPSCANPACSSGWLLPWRSRSRPILDGRWTCSPKCTEALLETAVARELEELQQARAIHRPRIPLGLALVEQGWISAEQLRNGLERQRQSRSSRLGSVLLQQHALNEERLARGLGVQWSCPVLDLKGFEPARMAPVLPRLLVDAYGALPVRLGGRSVFYLAFEESPDPTIALALERMNGLRVDCGFITDSQFRSAHASLLSAPFPPVTLVEAASPGAAVHAFGREIERRLPVTSRLVRVREFLWLRLWHRNPSYPIPQRGEVEDLVCSIGSH